MYFAIWASERLCVLRKYVSMGVNRPEIVEWLRLEFARTGRSKGALAKLWSKDASAVSNVLADKRKLGVEELEAAKAFFGSEPGQEGLPPEMPLESIDAQLAQLPDGAAKALIREFNAMIAGVRVVGKVKDP